MMKRYGSFAPAGRCTRCGRAQRAQAHFCEWCGQRVVRLDEEEDVGATIAPEFEADPERRPVKRINWQVQNYRQVQEEESHKTVSSEEKLARSPKEIRDEAQKEGIEFDNLPEPVKRILSRRDYYVVKYKLFEEQEGGVWKRI